MRITKENAVVGQMVYSFNCEISDEEEALLRSWLEKEKPEPEQYLIVERQGTFFAIQTSGECEADDVKKRVLTVHEIDDGWDFFDGPLEAILDSARSEERYGNICLMHAKVLREFAETRYGSR